MENLRSAAQAAKAEIERQRQEAERQRQSQEERDAINAQAERTLYAAMECESRARAAEFIDIMRDHDAPMVAYYDSIRSVSRYKQNLPPNEGETKTWTGNKVTHLMNRHGRKIMGWLAMRPYIIDIPAGPNFDTGRPSYVQVTRPGVFVDQAGETYPCSDEMKLGENEYSVGNEGPYGEPDPILLAGDEAFKRMATRLALRGII